MIQAFKIILVIVVLTLGTLFSLLILDVLTFDDLKTGTGKLLLLSLVALLTIGIIFMLANYGSNSNSKSTKK